jgi:hypothetical protein
MRIGWLVPVVLLGLAACSVNTAPPPAVAAPRTTVVTPGSTVVTPTPGSAVVTTP